MRCCLKEKRKKHGLSQKEFADRLFVKESAVSKW
ncbi:MAG: helix-turn-helix domain-containing protein [Ruminococcus sp.]|nr:helix-turn-helix domain-containing protein [Ruminococcus sp.]